MSESTQARPVHRPFWSRRETWIVALALAVLGAGVVAVPTVLAFRGLGGHGGPGFDHGLIQDPERAREHAALGVEWAFRAVDATEAQKAEGKAVVERLVDQMIPLAERHRAHREALARELVKPQIDRAALEQLREEGMAMADDASRIAVDGVADLAEVLSPEQRAELLELLHRFHGGGHPPIGQGWSQWAWTGGGQPPARLVPGQANLPRRRRATPSRRGRRGERCGLGCRRWASGS